MIGRDDQHIAPAKGLQNFWQTAIEGFQGRSIAVGIVSMAVQGKVAPELLRQAPNDLWI